MTTELQGNWHYPTTLRAGAGRIRELVDACQAVGIRAPLLVTDPGLAKLPMTGAAIEQCRAAGLAVEIFSAIEGNPSGEQVEQGVAAFRSNQHDGVIAFGGGSALDAGKAIAMLSGQQLPLWNFEDVGDNWTRVNEAGIAAVVAVPTTAGTGSEVGRASVITDSGAQVKRIIFHPAMLPQQVILDPELTVGLPAAITAATGIDALSHNLEAFCCSAYHPMADGIALEGMRLVQQYLPRAVADGTDIDARMQMLTASSMGASAFQKGLGAMHALAHSLGALYGSHHGLLNAILMPYVLVANRSVITEKMVRLGRYLELGNPCFDTVLDWILDLRQQVGIAHALADIGVDDRRAEQIGVMAVADPSAGGNPIRFSAQQYTNIFINALKGIL